MFGILYIHTILRVLRVQAPRDLTAPSMYLLNTMLHYLNTEIYYLDIIVLIACDGGDSFFTPPGKRRNYHRGYQSTKQTENLGELGKFLFSPSFRAGQQLQAYFLQLFLKIVPSPPLQRPFPQPALTYLSDQTKSPPLLINLPYYVLSISLFLVTPATVSKKRQLARSTRVVGHRTRDAAERR